MFTFKHEKNNQTLSNDWPTYCHTGIYHTNTTFYLYCLIRDRPFNLQGWGYGFLFHSEFFFRTTQELEKKKKIVVQSTNLYPQFNIRLIDKNSESDYFFFPPPKSEYFFQQHWESEYFF
jgi:hypothetical protein